MSSSRQKGAPISEPFPCPECGQLEMVYAVAACRLADGVRVKKLRHLTCRACGTRFFDDEAMREIQSARASLGGTIAS